MPDNPAIICQKIQLINCAFMSFKGINYGRIAEDSPSLALFSMAGGHPILSINYSTINNSTINKNDIIVETASDEVGNDDCMCEIRFHVEEPKEEKDEENQMENEEEQQKEKERDKESAAEKIYKQIVERAKIGEFAGESLATLLDVNLSVPRGKYTIDFYQKNIRFHGMTFNYTIEYKNITRGFILPMTNESQVSIVLQLNKDKPIYQGQTVYRYIVIQIKKEIEVDIKTKVSPQAQENNPNLKELQPEYSGAQFQVFVELIHATAGLNLIQPGAHFKSRAGQPCIKANVKAQAGWLYMLKQSLIFIPKPILYFRIDEIQAVEFHRINASNKQFDIKISLREEKKVVEFLGVERGELDALVEYFKAREVKVIMQQQEQNKIVDVADQDESEDEDFEAEEVSESDQDSEDEGELGSEQESSSNKRKKQKKQKSEKKEE